MKRLAMAIVAGAVAAACSGSMPAAPGPVASGSTSATDAKPSTGVVRNWVAHLSGKNENPANDSRGQGQVTYQLSADGTELRWQLIASNIDNVFMAHIHLGAADANGPIVLWLYGTPPASSNPVGTGRQNGVLSSGVATAENLVGQLANQPLSALVEQMDAGNTYTNVHTEDGMTPDTVPAAPGDIPGGEIRGQNRPAGH